MGKAWVLDTGTKGTGAQMVPLESALEKPAPPGPATRTERKPKPDQAPEPPPKPRQPPRFRVVDALSRQVLAENATTRATVDLLEHIASVVNVSIYVMADGEHWRPLTLGERQTLWKFRGRRESDS